MEDKALEISTILWKWYKKAISIDKGDKEWDELIHEAIEMSKKYQGDDLNFPLFEKMFFAFQDHVARLEKVGRDERSKD